METLVSCILSESLCSGDSVCNEMLPGPYYCLASSRLWPLRSLETGGWERVATWALETKFFLLLLCFWSLWLNLCVCVCMCLLGEGIFKNTAGEMWSEARWLAHLQGNMRFAGCLLGRGSVNLVIHASWVRFHIIRGDIWIKLPCSVVALTCHKS